MFRFLRLFWCASVLTFGAPLSLYPPVLTLSATAGSNPMLQPIVVSPADPGAVWTATTTADWLKLSDASGVGYRTMTASADTTGLIPGVYSGKVRIQADGSPSADVEVVLRVGFSNDRGAGKEWHVTVDGS